MAQNNKNSDISNIKHHTSHCKSPLQKERILLINLFIYLFFCFLGFAPSNNLSTLKLCAYQSPIRRSNSCSGFGNGTLMTILLLIRIGPNPPPAR